MRRNHCNHNVLVRFLPWLLILLFAVTAVAQSSVEVHIKDQEGRPVPNAEVKLKKGATETRSVTDSEGSCTFFGAEPGDYEVIVSAAGFEKTTGKVTLRAYAQSDLQLKLTPRGKT